MGFIGFRASEPRTLGLRTLLAGCNVAGIRNSGFRSVQAQTVTLNPKPKARNPERPKTGVGVQGLYRVQGLGLQPCVLTKASDATLHPSDGVTFVLLMGPYFRTL